MVPDFIMAALQTQSRANEPQILTRAHHVLQILSRQFTAGNAVMGKDPTSDSTVYDFCYKLAAQNHDVILISNNVQWKNISCIITLNVQDLKNMLSNTVKPVKRLVDDFNYQITIPNDTNIEEEKVISDSTSISARIQFNSNKNELSETQIISRIHFNTKKNEILAPKETVDIGVQAELNLSQESSPKEFNSLGVNTELSYIGNLNEKSEEQFTCDRDVADSAEVPKRKEIRLKRNLSHQSVNDNNVEKKQFKWRRKRNASMSYANVKDKKTTPYSSSAFNIQPSRLNNNLLPETRSTSYEPVDGSETSSSGFIQKSLDDKVVIEETSTSGVISNSADSESTNSIKHSEQMFKKLLYEETDVCKCVIFEVESPIMEEYLKMKSDEWVSRFVQIMEEVLSQILQQTPTFSNRTLPPPWTIHEATECVKKKFEKDSDVKDAANRLTNILFKISDGRGKINVDLKPSEFMEMYSYGVYLVDALQSVLSNSEDLQTAADSLAKLLSDIQDTSHTDAFMDSTHLAPADFSEIDTGINKIFNGVKRNMSKPEEKKSPDLKSPTCSSSNTEETKYNLRSRQKKTAENEVPTEQPVTFIRKLDIESTFFSSLNLKKNQYIAEDTNRIATNRATCLNSLLTSDQNKISERLDNAESQHNIEAQNDKPNEPKIIRNFTKCLEFEEKLKNNQKQTMEVVDTLDYSQNYDENDDDGYDYYDNYSHCEYDFYENEEEIDEMETYGDKKNVIDKTTVDKNSYTDVKLVICRLVNEIQETFLEVHSFCAKIIEELSVSKTLKVTLSPPRKLEIKGKAETARFVIDTLSKSLNSILSREEGDCEAKIQNIFKEAAIQLDGNEPITYRNIIAQYQRQSSILLDAVNIVIEAVKT